MFGLTKEEIRQEWDALETPMLSNVFMDAARHINGTATTKTRLSQCAGLSVDVFDTYDEQAIVSSLDALIRRGAADKNPANDAFIRPIFDALVASSAMSSRDPKVLAAAVRDVQLPQADIQWKPRAIIMF